MPGFILHDAGMVCWPGWARCSVVLCVRTCFELRVLTTCGFFVCYAGELALRNMDKYWGLTLDKLHLSGASLPKALLVETDAQDGVPARPGGVLVGHIVLKGIQLGTVLGCAGGALSAMWRQAPLYANASLWGWRGASCGALVMAVKATDGKDAYGANPLTEEGVIDRGYRIAHNENQIFVDCVSGAAASAGFLATKGKPAGAALGMAIGLASCPLLWRMAYTPGGWANW